MKIVIDVPVSYYSACKDWQSTNIATVAEGIIASGIPLVDITDDEWLKEILRRY